MAEINNECANFKYWEEMTPEEQEQVDLAMWAGKQPNEGGPESVIKFLPLDASAVCTTVQTLETIRDALASDAKARALQNEWNCMDVDYFFKLLKLRARSDAGEVR